MVSFWYSKDIFFFDMKCLQFLVHVFLDCKLSFLLLWRKYCTVRRMRMRHKACKGHWEFRFTFHSFWQPAQIHIHVQLAPRWHVLCQRCRMPGEIPSAPNRLYQASALWRPVALSLLNIGKTGFIATSKTNILELRYFDAKQRYFT